MSILDHAREVTAMMNKRYVQHISGQGAKWEVSNENSLGYVVSINGHAWAATLPKSEYRLVDPPERWVDVTEHCRVAHDGRAIVLYPHTIATIHGDDNKRDGSYVPYRFDQTNGHTFYIQKREP